MASPALWILREAFPDSKIILVSEFSQKIGSTFAESVFSGSGLVDEIIEFEGYNAPSLITKVKSCLSLYKRLRKLYIDIGIALDLSDKVRWEPLVMKTLGIEKVIHPRSQICRNNVFHGTPMTEVNIADQLVTLMKDLKIPVPPSGQGRMDLNLTLTEQAQIQHFVIQSGLKLLPRPWVAVAPWSNMSSKEWPIERFVTILSTLHEITNCTPILFGGKENFSAGRSIVNQLGFGFSVAGILGVRQSVALMSHCNLYIGNDCGAMHMAVAAGLRCVAIFSARDKPGLWEPYGSGHITIRKSVPCEKCMLHECVDRRKECLLDIQPQEVVGCALALLENSESN